MFKSCQTLGISGFPQTILDLNEPLEEGNVDWNPLLAILNRISVEI